MLVYLTDFFVHSLELPYIWKTIGDEVSTDKAFVPNVGYFK